MTNFAEIEQQKRDLRSQIVGLDQFDASLIDIPLCNMPGGNQVAQPLRRVWINLVVVGFSHGRCP